MEYVHKPVLVKETVAGLNLKPGSICIDATVGGGGHARAILEEILPGGLLVGVDRDREALEAAQRNLSETGAAFIPIRDRFTNIKKIAGELGLARVDGILFDLGVSSYQLDNPSRGFTYHENVPLDMRMDQTEGITAADLVNSLTEVELSRVISEFGEERWARRIAGAILAVRRSGKRIETSGELVAAIKRAIPARARRAGGHPARRTFQALRIAVNQELDSIPPALEEAAGLLAPGGRMAVITFHSLEDRMVKKVFRGLEGRCSCPPGLPVCGCGVEGEFRVITRKPILPLAEEVEANNRARSAKLRIAEKRLVSRERAGEW